MTEQIVALVLGTLTVIAAVAPWVWNRRGGLRGSIVKRLVISLSATIAVAYACLWTQADAHTMTASGDRALCGGGVIVRCAGEDIFICWTPVSNSLKDSPMNASSRVGLLSQ